jgi:hypothetical protein
VLSYVQVADIRDQLSFSGSGVESGDTSSKRTVLSYVVLDFGPYS